MHIVLRKNTLIINKTIGYKWQNEFIIEGGNRPKGYPNCYLLIIKNGTNFVISDANDKRSNIPKDSCDELNKIMNQYGKNNLARWKPGNFESGNLTGSGLLNNKCHTLSCYNDEYDIQCVRYDNVDSIKDIEEKKAAAKAAEEAAAKAAAEKAALEATQKTQLKNSIESIQKKINDLKTDIYNISTNANSQKNDLEAFNDAQTFNDANEYKITINKPDISDDMSTIDKIKSNIQNINITLPSENADLQSFEAVKQQIISEKNTANNNKNKAQTALTNIETAVRDYKNKVGREIEEIRIEKERIKKLEQERKNLIIENENSKEILRQLDSKKMLLKDKIIIEGGNNQSLNDQLIKLNSEIEIVNKEIKDTDEKIKNFSFAKISRKIKGWKTLVNNMIDDLNPDGNVIGFTNMNEGFVYNQFSNNHNKHQRNIYTIPISDEYD